MFPNNGTAMFLENKDLETFIVPKKEVSSSDQDNLTENGEIEIGPVLCRKKPEPASVISPFLKVFRVFAFFFLVRLIISLLVSNKYIKPRHTP